ncbi:MAG: hypothetical protein JNL98_35860, partial [Bryobacterales bacterium]|nr:hypothetical protein [Bryobacterales bacterium]
MPARNGTPGGASGGNASRGATRSTTRSAARNLAEYAVVRALLAIAASLPFGAASSVCTLLMR